MEIIILTNKYVDRPGFVLKAKLSIEVRGNKPHQGTKIFQYRTCPTGRVTLQFSLVQQTQCHALVL